MSVGCRGGAFSWDNDFGGQPSGQPGGVAGDRAVFITSIFSHDRFLDQVRPTIVEPGALGQHGNAANRASTCNTSPQRKKYSVNFKLSNFYPEKPCDFV